MPLGFVEILGKNLDSSGTLTLPMCKGNRMQLALCIFNSLHGRGEMSKRIFKFSIEF